MPVRFLKKIEILVMAVGNELINKRIIPIIKQRIAASTIKSFQP